MSNGPSALGAEAVPPRIPQSHHLAPGVRGMLRIDVSPAVDHLGLLEGREADHLALSLTIPHGVAVELHIGACRAVLGTVGGLIGALRPAGQVVVVGSDPAGISAVHGALARAFAVRGAA